MELAVDLDHAYEPFLMHNKHAIKRLRRRRIDEHASSSGGKGGL